MSDDSQPDNNSSSSVGWIPYVLAGISFIPCLGVPFGIVAIIWGIIKKAWVVVLLGSLGIAFTVVLYGALFYLGMYQRGGPYDQLRAKMAVSMLNSTVKEIEFYKVQHGSYPKSLADLDAQEKNGFVSSTDPTAIERKGPMDARFYYELDPSGKFYYVRSVGPDGIPFTADDILPSLSPTETLNTGLRLEKSGGSPDTNSDSPAHP